MTDIIAIPFDKLVPWDGNVRKTGAADGIEELAASIEAHGVLQSLTVRKLKGAKYQIIAGRRRYLALKLLVENGTMRADRTVPCTLAGYRELLQLLEHYARIGLNELREVNPLTRGKAAAEIIDELDAEMPPQNE